MKTQKTVLCMLFQAARNDQTWSNNDDVKGLAVFVDAIPWLWESQLTAALMTLSGMVQAFIGTDPCAANSNI